MLKSKENKEFLGQLMKTFSPSGVETESLKVFADFLEQRGLEKYYSDLMGNLAYRIGNGKKTILLSGHIDEVAARVQNISKSGVITILNTGGMCKKSLIASEVVLLGDNGPVIGVVEKKPIHLEDDDRDKIGKTETLKINVGAESKEDVESLGIYPGCCVCYQRRSLLDFGFNQVCGTGLDDKIAVYIVGCILDRLSKEDPALFEDYTIIGCACCQEETGARGARVVARNINPDISIDFDVTFSTDGDLGVSPDRCGDVRLGEGGVIEYGPDKSIRLAKVMKDVCKKHNISYQTASSHAGGTNTHVFQEYSEDCETLLISIPNRSMHTPVEVCSWKDVDSIIDMVVKAIIEKTL